MSAELNEQSNAIVSTTDLVNVFHTVCGIAEDGVEAAKEFFESDTVQTIADYAQVIDETAENGLKVYGIFRKLADLPSKLYLRKFDRYMKGVTDIPVKKRQAYLKLVTKERFNKESVYILEVINRIEDLEKIDILVRLLELKMDETITDAEYRRMMIMTASTMKEDLDYLRLNITNDSFVIKSVQEEGLLLSGWIIYEGMTWGTAENDSGNLYRYTAMAKRYCEIVFGVTASGSNSNGPIKFTPVEADEQDIKKIFVEDETIHIE